MDVRKLLTLTVNRVLQGVSNQCGGCSTSERICLTRNHHHFWTHIVKIRFFILARVIMQLWCNNTMVYHPYIIVGILIKMGLITFWFDEFLFIRISSLAVLISYNHSDVLSYEVYVKSFKMVLFGYSKITIVNYACCHVAFGRNLRIFEVIRYQQKFT